MLPISVWGFQENSKNLSLHLGFNFFTPKVGGILACSNANNTLMSDVKPLAASEWPIEDLIYKLLAKLHHTYLDL